MFFKKNKIKHEKNSDVGIIFVSIISLIVAVVMAISINKIDLKIFFDDTDDVNNSKKSETSIQSTVNSLTESTSAHTESQTEEENFYVLDSEKKQNHYPAEFIGKTVVEVINILGEPQEIKAGFLGGGGTDTAYLYDDGNIIFIALFDSSNNYDFDDRNAKINYICIWDGKLNEYVETGISYNEINQIYSLSDYSYSAYDNTYTASADLRCNNYNCNLIITNSDGNKTSPVNRILLTCRDINN